MEKEMRKQKLKELQEGDANVVMTGIPLRYKGSTRQMKVFKIPLDCLVYNKHNGRIASLTMSYEKQNGTLNPELDADKKIIANFLWDSKKDRNQTTLDNLKEHQQQRYGIVTADGIIIDGNRRAMLLNKLRKQGVDHAEYFLAIILPEDATDKEINKLEAMYQMGEDDKLDYKPIEKYLKCRQLKLSGFNEKEIAKFMAVKDTDIVEWLAVLDLMDKYLKEYGYEGMYTRLPEESFTSFVELNKFLSSYRKAGANVEGMNWNPTEADLNELRVIFFDYIRAEVDVREVREIARTGQAGSIFFYEDMWAHFKNNHKTVEEKEVDELRAEKTDIDLDIILKNRDAEWRKKVASEFKENVGRQKKRLENKRDENKPHLLIRRALDALEQVDIDGAGFISEDTIPDMVRRINTIVWEMKKRVDKLKR